MANHENKILSVMSKLENEVHAMKYDMDKQRKVFDSKVSSCENKIKQLEIELVQNHSRRNIALDKVKGESV